LYALIVNGELIAVRNPGRIERKLSDGVRLSPPLGTWTEELAAACGFLPVTDPGPPALTDAQVVDAQIVQLDEQARPVYVYVVRNKTAEELAAEAAAAAAKQLAAARAASVAALTDLDAIQARIADIKAFLVDPDIQAVLDVANTTPLTTQQTNRALKALVRQARRDANLTLRVARYAIGQARPELLDDVTDV
jgi:multidrug efflux pump subunit AcrA (membrane-fusion protein)